MNEYYQRISEVVGYQGHFKHDLSKPTGMRQKLIDNTKLHSFGWSPKTSLNAGINHTINFYLNEQDND